MKEFTHDQIAEEKEKEDRLTSAMEFWDWRVLSINYLWGTWQKKQPTGLGFKPFPYVMLSLEGQDTLTKSPPGSQGKEKGEDPLQPPHSLMAQPKRPA